jgi:hypothetical protein
VLLIEPTHVRRRRHLYEARFDEKGAGIDTIFI